MKHKIEIGKVSMVSGPLIIAKGLKNIKLNEIAKVGNEKLIGEVIRIDNESVYIQVYEDTSGLKPGEPVESTGSPLSAECGPGMLGTIYDGIQRPLSEILKQTNNHFLSRGVSVPALDRNKKWSFKANVKNGDIVRAGDIIGTVQETSSIELRIIVPHHIKEGVIENIKSGDFTVMDVIATINDEEITLMQKWSVRDPRPFKERLVPTTQLKTGWRVLDVFFPMPKGGTGAIPGDFGTGKTMALSGVAKFCDADIVVYVGCGERGNEMTEMLEVFPTLEDPKTGKPLMERTVIVANTSNMPVAARESSMYMGITIAEYYRDQGYNVVLLADSTSRWAEAMREMSGRLEEMPGEEGYPAYLGSRMGQLYSRAGDVVCVGGDRRGSITTIGSVSPQGGDFSEPVTQNTLRLVKIFWGLSAPLAARRHYPSVDWLNSYSLYLDNLKETWTKEFNQDFLNLRNEAMKILREEDRLSELVQLVGMDALAPKEKLIMIVARVLREDFLQQNAFDPIDRYMDMEFQYLLLKTIMSLWYEGLKVFKENPEIDFLKINDKDSMEKLGRIKLSRKKEEYNSLVSIIRDDLTEISKEEYN